MYCDSRKPLLTCVNAAHGFRWLLQILMESGGSGIATTQSHHQGRASKHEHGDASTYSSTVPMPPVDGRLEPFLFTTSA